MKAKKRVTKARKPRLDKGAVAERAAIVSFLRDMASLRVGSSPFAIIEVGTMLQLADMFEQGRHLPEYWGL